MDRALLAPHLECQEAGPAFRRPFPLCARRADPLMTHSDTPAGGSLVPAQPGHQQGGAATHFLPGGGPSRAQCLLLFPRSTETPKPCALRSELGSTEDPQDPQAGCDRGRGPGARLGVHVCANWTGGQGRESRGYPMVWGVWEPPAQVTGDKLRGGLPSACIAPVPVGLGSWLWVPPRGHSLREGEWPGVGAIDCPSQSLPGAAGAEPQVGGCSGRTDRPGAGSSVPARRPGWTWNQWSCPSRAVAAAAPEAALRAAFSPLGSCVAKSPLEPWE